MRTAICALRCLLNSCPHQNGVQQHRVTFATVLIHPVLIHYGVQRSRCSRVSMTPGRLVVGTKGNVMTLQAHLLTSRPTCHAPDTRHGWVRVPQLLTVLCLMTWGWMSPVASASTSCVFISSESTLRLTADCTTNSTLYIPEGFTLDGQGFTITAVNPSTGSFQGAVIQNAGKVAHVVNVGVRGSGILNTCAQGEARLKGISLYKASGSILNSRVEDLHRGASSCEEGNAIDVSNPPYDGSHPATLSVTISGNSVDRVGGR